MTSDGGRGDRFQQVNNRVKAENGRNGNGVVSDGPKSRIDDKLRIGLVDENVKDGCHQEVVRGKAVHQAPKFHLQGPLVHWERFLHVRSIKVMLVENDDSTRHIVTALLRNCNYEVIEAANGFQAWKILEDMSNHIDIVLTEVVMPCISGICLLCKIMSHKTRKNIPVIMMSSHDSMGLVFKCLSKGAVDFLVKPVRKNELKTLWQHVWRRCHSSSGSGTGSESGTQAQKSVNSKSSLRSNDSGSNIGDNTDDGSDDVSGTQSSWTRQAVELENSQSAAPCDQITECPDSTCGLVIRSAPTQATREFNGQETKPYNGGKGKELAIGRYKDSEMQTEFPVKVPMKHNGIKQNILQVCDPTQPIKTKNEGQADIIGDHMSNKRKAKEHREFEAFGEPKKVLDLNIKLTDDSNGVTSGDFSLKRPRRVKDDMIEVQNGCNILKHSELSAFTRYNTTSNALKTSHGTTASSSPIDNRSKMVKKESTRDAHSEGFPPRDLHQELSIQHIYHHHHAHHYHTVDTKQPLSNREAAEAPHGSSNILGGAVEGNLEFHSLNRSVSGSKHGSGGSKHGSNGQSGSSTVVNLEVTNVESDVALAGKSGSGSEDRINHHRSAQREAALTKFRQKRNERCFQKKVRYQNRKRLAEQRPRVRGQFVKQTVRGSSNNAADG